MTVIAALLDPVTWAAIIGADTTVWHGNVYTRGHRKIRRVGDWAAGAAGAAWTGEMVEDCLMCTPVGVSFDLVAKAFRDECFAWSKERGHGSTEGGHHSYPWTVLLIGPGCLFEIAGDGTILNHPDGYAAIGSGGAVACGALHATRLLGVDASHRMTLALEAAAEHADGVAGPFDYECVPDGSDG